MESGSERDRTVGDLRSRTPGEDSEDPYRDVVISELPEWWQEAIEEFRRHGLRPYRPPRFEDGVLKHEIVEDLERDHGIDIRFVAYNSQFEDDWEVHVDGESIGDVGRHRSPEGYTVFETDSEEFVEFVESNL